MSLTQSLLLALAASACFAADAPAPVPLDRAVSTISLPPGFRATLFAGEPDIVQPIAMATDHRGRLWVVECLSYPTWTTNHTGRDRVTILEDRNGDGTFDQRTVFWDQGRNLSGIALGFGGVWLCSVPELIFIPDADGDDRPDSAPQVLLDGWDLRSQHNVFSNLNWGPDGWLYGCNGILSNSRVGPPGSPDQSRIPINCGVWRYHPTRKIFEAVAHGTTNPWGIAFDQYGQMFVANCVIKHLFHMIPGGHYERMFGQDFNPYAFQLIPSIADHIHWAGGFWKTEGADHPRNDLAGGGHAHSGAMIYQGGSWPDAYRGQFLTVNIHGHRVNQDRLDRLGSGYIARHNDDLLRVNDTWFRGVSVISSQDGNIFVSDWSDAGECHDYEDIHRENGRIYKISHGHATVPSIDLQRLSPADLVRNLSDKNEWIAARSRLVLQERAAQIPRQIRENLWQSLRQGSDSHARLRALWALHALDELPHDRVLRLLDDPDEYIRAWTIQLALETSGENATLNERLARLAPIETSPIVRLYLSSALQRMPPAPRLALASGLVTHAEDASDPNLPLMIWYGIEPLIAQNPSAALTLLQRAAIPQLRQFIAQRLALAGQFNPLSASLLKAQPAAQADFVQGMFIALNGRRQLPMPEGWTNAAAALDQHPRQEVRDQARRLSLAFGDERVVQQLVALVQNPGADPSARASALEGLLQARQPEVPNLLREALTDPALRGPALRALASFDDPTIPARILDIYSQLNPTEKAEAINTLASRAPFAAALLQAVRQGAIPTRDLTPFTARQIQAYQDPDLERALKALVSVRAIAGDKKAQIAKYKSLLTPSALSQADLSKGRTVYQRTCAACHKLFDQGGSLAPELTGSQRSNLEYLLENIVDPNAVVWDRYKATYFETKDDRLISGAVLSENHGTVAIQTQTGIVTLPRDEITSRRVSSLSMMPEGLLESLPDHEVVQLVAYLQSQNQVPLPKD